jgi:hypothetical protein
MTAIHNSAIIKKNGANLRVASEELGRKVMTSINGDAHGVSHGRGSVADRLRAFMRTHDLSSEELADALRIPPHVLVQWLHGIVMAPACLLIALPLYATRLQARTYPCASHEETLRRMQAI